MSPHLDSTRSRAGAIIASCFYRRPLTGQCSRGRGAAFMAASDLGLEREGRRQPRGLRRTRAEPPLSRAPDSLHPVRFASPLDRPRGRSFTYQLHSWCYVRTSSTARPFPADISAGHYLSSDAHLSPDGALSARVPQMPTVMQTALLRLRGRQERPQNSLPHVHSVDSMDLHRPCFGTPTARERSSRRSATRWRRRRVVRGTSAHLQKSGCVGVLRGRQHAGRRADAQGLVRLR